jgi:hypothetical protein
MDRINDGLQNYVNLVGSTIDPTAAYVLSKDCEQPYLEWYGNGGLAEKITSFWANCIGTGLVVNVAAQRESGRNKKATATLQDWLQSEYDRLDVLGIFKEAEVQCNIDCAAPIIVLTDGNDPLNNVPTRYSRVEMLQIQDPQYFRPQIRTLFGHKSVDHRLVEYYANSLGNQTTIHTSRVLPLAARKLLRSEKWGTVKEREWGRPLLGSSVLKAAIRYEAAIVISSILIEKKNMLVYGVRGFNDGMEGSGSDSYAMQAINQVKMLQQASNILNVALVDLDSSKLEAIDRNISGVSDLIDKSRQALLASLDNIPADYIFGEREKGGLNGGNDDLERNNNLANQKFKTRWLPHLNKLNLLLLNSSSCPIKNVDISTIEINRESSFVENPSDTADTRLKLLQGDQILIAMGAIDATEVRSRHVSPTFERELVLETTVAPGVQVNENQNQPATTAPTEDKTGGKRPDASNGRGSNGSKRASTN